jgi:hypothetical protein
VIRRGVPGFAGDRDVLSRRIDVPEFRAACFAAARATQMNLVGIEPGCQGQSFHIAELERRGQTVLVLCSSSSPVVAFTRPPLELGEIRFITRADLSAVFTELGYECPYVTELEQPLSEVDLSVLSKGELDAIAYWNPQKMGDVVFNWFD